MNNSFVVSFERLNDGHMESYFIGLQGKDVKDLTIQFLKLIYKKIHKIPFLDEKKTVIAELVNKNQLILVLNHNQIPLSQNDVEVLTSFFLEATDEYMEYDHIDFEFQTKTAEVNVCFMRT